MSEQEQGTMQGALYGVRAFGSGLGPLIMGLLLAYFSSSHAPIYLPQAPYIFATILAIICVAVAYTIPEDIRLDSVKEEKELRRKLKEHSIISAGLGEDESEQVPASSPFLENEEGSDEQTSSQQSSSVLSDSSSLRDDLEASHLKSSASFADVQVSQSKVLPAPAGEVQQ